MRNKIAAGILSLVLGAPASPSWAAAPAAPKLQKLRVSGNGRFLVRADGSPFFYLGDTAWRLIHRATRDEVRRYLDVRSRQGFNVIQVAALAGSEEGITTPNAHGDLPLVNREPHKPAVTPGADPNSPRQYDYWDHLDYLVDQANRRGIYVGLLPTWGRWVVKGTNPNDTIFNSTNALEYGRFLGKRYGSKGIIWVLGGDHPPAGVEEVWRSLARGVAEGASGSENPDAVLMTYHPRGRQTSSTWFHGDAWLDFNMQQTGHGVATEVRTWDRIARDYGRHPTKPVIDGEPLYEDHPIDFRAEKFGYATDAHVRQRAYWNVFSGAFGHTYGNHAVWQMYAPGRKPFHGPLYYWDEALERPGASQVRFLRALMESRPYLSRVPSQQIILATSSSSHVSATSGDGYVLVYSPEGEPFTLNLEKISHQSLKEWWYNPRTGSATAGETMPNRGTRDFVPPSRGFGSDWVLVLDDASKGFAAPGTSGWPEKESR